mmetsp:Transcript_62200/g.160378  ORF Transcript_62200/g.160378 Transcript_62200/m.160378 type:complete len:248 (-) Transcript_62200:263-1006(-)
MEYAKRLRCRMTISGRTRTRVLLMASTWSLQLLQCQRLLPSRRSSDSNSAESTLSRPRGRIGHAFSSLSTTGNERWRKSSCVEDEWPQQEHSMVDCSWPLKNPLMGAFKSTPATGSFFSAMPSLLPKRAGNLRSMLDVSSSSWSLLSMKSKNSWASCCARNAFFCSQEAFAVRHMWKREGTTAFRFCSSCQSCASSSRSPCEMIWLPCSSPKLELLGLDAKDVPTSFFGLWRRLGLRMSSAGSRASR